VALKASLVATVLFGGCSGNYPGGAVPVSGVVTLNGEPLEQGTVCFHDSNGMTVAIGMVDDGSFEMSRSESHHGVVPGAYKVSVMSWIEFPGMTMPNGSVSKGVSRVPQKYVDSKTSGLSAEVPDHAETINFAIEGQPEEVNSAPAKKARR
jgi:hypothetical protein